MKKIIIISIIALCLVIPQNVFSQTPSQPGQGISISSNNSGSPIQFNKKIFSWTDRVYITIYAP
ncbi:MAG TPA: hypothetical protein VFV16_09920, partial [Candidatus Nitrosotalea sp.]|nr:hypothetical protein [Candidatus Nitrosotalea sp.]